MPMFKDAAFTWGLWKVLDHLLLRYFPEWWPQMRGGGAGHNGAPGRRAIAALAWHGEDGSSAVATAADFDVQAVMRSAQFAAACRELGDADSPVLRALTALWAADADDPGSGADLDAALGGLSLEQGLVVLSVLAHAAGSRA